MIRLRARDGEVSIFHDPGCDPVPVGKPDIYWAGGELFRVWVSQYDMAKLRNSEIMEHAIDD